MPALRQIVRAARAIFAGPGLRLVPVGAIIGALIALGTLTWEDPQSVGHTAPMEPAELELQLVETRRQRFFVRSQLKVLRRHRDRRTAAGHPIGSSDARVAELERELEALDDAVEGLRARLGRPYRRR